MGGLKKLPTKIILHAAELCTVQKKRKNTKTQNLATDMYQWGQLTRSTVPLVAAKNCDRLFRPLTTKVGGQTCPFWSHSVIPRGVWSGLTSTAPGVLISNLFFVSSTVQYH